MPITQEQLAAYLNTVFGTDLIYRAMTSAELGAFIGPIIGRNYDAISKGTYDVPAIFRPSRAAPIRSGTSIFHPSLGNRDGTIAALRTTLDLSEKLPCPI